MKARILLTLFCIFAFNAVAFATVRSYSTELIESDIWRCEEEKYQDMPRLGNDGKIEAKLGTASATGSNTQLHIYLCTIREVNEDILSPSIMGMCRGIHRKGDAVKGYSATVYLENGESFLSTDASLVNATADSELKFLGILAVMLELESLSSSESYKYDHDGWQAHVLNSFASSDIVKIVVNGHTYNLSGFDTADTLRSMFAELYKKTGNSWLRFYSAGGSSPSHSPKSAASAYITKIRTEHNLAEYGERGMRVALNFTVSGMKGKTGMAVAYFYDADTGEALPDKNGRYCTTDGKVSASSEFTPPYDTTEETNFRIFIPLKELDINSADGPRNLEVKVHILDSDWNVLCKSEWLYFNCRFDPNKYPYMFTQAM